MHKEVIILTKSDKQGGYCIAGIDKNTRKFIRLVSDDEENEYTLFDRHITYSDGNMVSPLDIVKIKIKEKQDCWYQPENYIIDENAFEKIGQASVDEIKEYIDCDSDYIFFNNDKKISSEKLQQKNGIKSLQFAFIEELNLWKDKYNNNRLTASFKFSDNYYTFIKVTDSTLIERYKSCVQENDPMPYTINNVYVVFSLTGPYYRDNNHYKLLANIFESSPSIYAYNF